LDVEEGTGEIIRLNVSLRGVVQDATHQPVEVLLAVDTSLIGLIKLFAS